MKRNLKGLLGLYYRDTLFAAAFLLILAGGGLLIWSTSHVDSELHALASKASAMTIQADVVQRKLTSSRTQLVLERQLLSKAQARLRSGGSLNEGLSQILKLASDQKLRIDQLEPGEAVRKGLDQVPISLSGQGSYPSFVLFLRTMREQMPVALANSINLRAAGNGQVTFDVKLTWYAMPQTAPARLPAMLTEVTQ